MAFALSPLPPLECGFGVIPNHAERSRPDLKPDLSGSVATRALAVIGPMPGMVCKRCAASFVFASIWTSAVRSSILLRVSTTWSASRFNALRAGGSHCHRLQSGGMNCGCPWAGHCRTLGEGCGRAGTKRSGGAFRLSQGPQGPNSPSRSGTVAPVGPRKPGEGPDRIHDLCLLMNQKFPGLVRHQHRLGLFALHRDKAHGWPRLRCRAFSTFDRSTGPIDRCATGSKPSQMASASALSVFPR
jgi:hypothetical protein